MAKPKIVVIGAGAVGSLVGGLLSLKGEDVTLVGRAAHVKAIRERGLRIEGVLGSMTVEVNASERLDFRPDIVLLAVKSQDVEAACREIKSFVDDATILTLQNGVRGDEMVAQTLPKQNILSGVVMFNAQYWEPGLITYARAGMLVIGEAFGQNGQRVDDLRVLFNRAIPTEISPDIHAAHWTKLLINNTSNGLEALTGMPIKECLRYPVMRRIGVVTIKEAYGTIQKAGFEPGPLPGVPMPALRFMIGAPEPLSSLSIRLFMGSLKTLSSTLQSLQRGRPTEIDYLNGEIVRLGREVGMPTPYNGKLVELVKRAEATRRFMTPDELSVAFLFA